MALNMYYDDDFEEWYYAEDYTEGLNDTAASQDYVSPTGRIRKRNPPIQTFNPYLSLTLPAYAHTDIEATLAIYKQKGNVMDLSQKADILQQQLNELLRQIAVLNRFPKADPCTDGQVITFSKKFGGTDLPYLYAAVRVDGKYYLSGGRTSPQGYTWEELVEFMGSKTASIMLMVPSQELMNLPQKTQVTTEPPTDEKIQGKKPRAIYDNPQA